MHKTKNAIPANLTQVQRRREVLGKEATRSFTLACSQWPSIEKVGANKQSPIDSVKDDLRVLVPSIYKVVTDQPRYEYG